MHRCIKLALVHDMAECIVGDIAPSDNISKAEKHRREEASATPTFADLMHHISIFLLSCLFLGSNETPHRSSAGGAQAGDLCPVGGS